MRVLITGITGFAGSHLADFLLAERKDVDIYGMVRWRSKTENIEHIRDKIRLYECDIRDAYSVNKVIQNLKKRQVGSQR